MTDCCPSLRGKTLLDLSPAYEAGWASYGWTLLLMGRYPEALEAASKESSEAGKLALLAAVYGPLARPKDADQALALLEQKYGRSQPAAIADVHAYRGDSTGAFAWLERGSQLRDPSMTAIKIDPLLRSLRADPRYPLLLRKMNLAGLCRQNVATRLRTAVMQRIARPRDLLARHKPTCGDCQQGAPVLTH